MVVCLDQIGTIGWGTEECSVGDNFVQWPVPEGG